MLYSPTFRGADVCFRCYPGPEQAHIDHYQAWFILGLRSCTVQLPSINLTQKLCTGVKSSQESFVEQLYMTAGCNWKTVPGLSAKLL